METRALADTDLSAMRWQLRPVVVLAQPDDPRLTEQLALFAREEPAMAERAMPVIVGTLEEGEALLSRAPEGEAATEFAVLLIGKDGGVKARHDTVVDPAALTALVDTMPMRRSESAD